jgi:hypothetical protein
MYAPSGIPKTQLITTAELETINDKVMIGQISLISVCIGSVFENATPQK